MGNSVLLFTNESHSFPVGNEPTKSTKTFFEPEMTPPPMGTVGAGHAAKLPPWEPRAIGKGFPLTT